MQLKNFCISFWLTLTVCLAFFSSTHAEPPSPHEKRSAAEYMADTPPNTYADTAPKENPHPPQNDQDRRRVEVAEYFIKNYLMNQDQKMELSKVTVQKRIEGLSVAESCLKNKECTAKNPIFQNFVASIYHSFGPVAEFKHAHVIPWSMEKYQKNKISRQQEKPAEVAGLIGQSMPSPIVYDDEFLVHVYARFKNQSIGHHVDVILAESESGEPILRGFFSTPMSDDLPHGIVCQILIFSCRSTDSSAANAICEEKIAS